jgi:hypothetical protein
MKITDFKVIYICPDHNEKYSLRKQHMETLLNRIGFKNIIHFKSGTENYPRCLVNATINILESNLDEPFLLLEDDVEWSGSADFDFNTSADAIYFGLSRSAGDGHNNTHNGPSKFIKWSDSQVRVINMLGGHAIFYISREYKTAVINILKQYENTDYYNDVLMSRIQNSFIVLAQKAPFFYQSSKFNVSDVEYQTRFEITL